MKRICILLPCEYPYITGEPFLENEMQYLSRTFSTIYIFPFNAKSTMTPTRKVPDNVKVFPVGCIWSKLRYPAYILRGLFSKEKRLKVRIKGIRRVLTCLYERGRSDFVFHSVIKVLRNEDLALCNVLVYSYWFTDQAVVAWRLKQFLEAEGLSVKAVARGHGYDINENRNPSGYLPYQEESLKYLDGFYPCSDEGNRHIAEKYPMFADKICTARLGTADHGVQEYHQEEKVFLTCSSLYGFKRTSLFAQAFALLCKRRSDCKWICIGDGEELDLIRKIINANHIGDRVSLMGRMKNQDVLSYYEKSGITYFCNVSTTEGLPVSIMEALSFGIPVLATDVGGTGELVSTHTGRLLPKELTVETLADFLQDAVSLSPEEYQRKRQNARATWEEKSSADRNYKHWCEMLIG